MNWKRWLLVAASGLGLLFLLLPIGVLIVRGVQTRAWEGLPDASIGEAVYLSFATTMLTALVTVFFGTPLAYVFARWQFPLKGVLNVLVELPIVFPPAVAGLALLTTFGRRGFLGPLLGSFGVSLPFTTAAVVFAQTFVSAPFYIRSAQVGFQNVPREIEDAARVDGASGLRLFRYITLPRAGGVWRDHSIRRQFAGANADHAAANIQRAGARHQCGYLDGLIVDRAGIHCPRRITIVGAPP
jgi:molybdate transport system permease protein